LNENSEIKEIILKEKLKINEELNLFNTYSIMNNPEIKKEECPSNKLKKIKNRVN